MMRFIGEPVTEQEIEVPVVVIEVPGVVHQRTGHRASNLRCRVLHMDFPCRPVLDKINQTIRTIIMRHSVIPLTKSPPLHSYHFFNISI